MIKKEVKRRVPPGELTETETQQTGEGRRDKAGLFDTEINAMMKDFKEDGWTQCIASDEIPKLLKHVKKGKPLAFIINTDPSNKPGEHWQAVYIDPKRDRSVEFYDSYGDSPSLELMKGIKLIIGKMKPETYLKFKVNKIKEQSANTANCGWFCMKFLIDRFNGIPFKECTGFSQVAKGERDIKKFKKKFGYI